MQAKAKAKIATSSTIASVSNQTTATTSMTASSTVPAVVTSTITTQPMHSAPTGIHPVQSTAQAPSNPQQQSQPHNIVAPHIPILMDPLVQSNYLISI